MRVDLQRLAVVALRVLKALQLAVGKPTTREQLEGERARLTAAAAVFRGSAEGGEGGAGVVDAESVVALLQVAGGAVGEALAPEEEPSGSRGPEVEVDRKTYDLPVASSSTALVRRALSQRSRGSDRES